MRTIKAKGIVLAALLTAMIAVALPGCTSGGTAPETNDANDASATANAESNEQATSDGSLIVDTTKKILDKNELGLDGTTPQTITSAEYPELFAEVSEKTGLDISDCEVECNVDTIVSETVRGVHEKYTFSIQRMDATVDGVQLHYDVENGYSSN